ncbi:MAG TPA: glycerophosphodiester phosphodiesterase family protein [Vicinamibacteria bacterium]
MTPLVIAHRGDSAHRPENTKVAFVSALEVGAELVEFDVQLTRDGEPVVLHDAAVDRTTDGHGRLADLTLREVRALSAGYPARFGSAYAGEKVPTLAEVLALLRGRARALIEIKAESVGADGRDGVEAITVAAVRKAGVEDGAALISFDHRALLRCRELAPEIVRGHLFLRAAVGEALALSREAGCEIVLPEKGMLSDEMRERAREAGLKLATWVVDDEAELPGLARFELYGIGTNRPGPMLEALRETA